MSIEKVKDDLLTAANAIYWRARRVTGWHSRISDWGCDSVEMAAGFDYGDFQIPISITLRVSNPDPWILEIKLGNSAARVSYKPRGDNAAGLAIELTGMVRQLHPMFMGARVYTTPEGVKYRCSGDTAPRPPTPVSVPMKAVSVDIGLSESPGRCISAIRYPHHDTDTDVEDTLKQRACADCRHFTYLRMDPYCNLKHAATEHDKKCRDFALPAPKPLTPQK